MAPTVRVGLRTLGELIFSCWSNPTLAIAKQPPTPEQRTKIMQMPLPLLVCNHPSQRYPKGRRIPEGARTRKKKKIASCLYRLLCSQHPSCGDVASQEAKSPNRKHPHLVHTSVGHQTQNTPHKQSSATPP